MFVLTESLQKENGLKLNYTAMARTYVNTYVRTYVRTHAGMHARTYVRSWKKIVKHQIESKAKITVSPFGILLIMFAIVKTMEKPKA